MSEPTIICPSCQTRLRPTGTPIGITLRCPRCGGQFEVADRAPASPESGSYRSFLPPLTVRLARRVGGRRHTFPLWVTGPPRGDGLRSLERSVKLTPPVAGPMPACPPRSPLGSHKGHHGQGRPQAFWHQDRLPPRSAGKDPTGLRDPTPRSASWVVSCSSASGCPVIRGATAATGSVPSSTTRRAWPATTSAGSAAGDRTARTSMSSRSPTGTSRSRRVPPGGAPGEPRATRPRRSTPASSRRRASSSTASGMPRSTTSGGSTGWGCPGGSPAPWRRKTSRTVPPRSWRSWTSNGPGCPWDRRPRCRPPSRQGQGPAPPPPPGTRVRASGSANTPALFGAGLIDAIPDRVIEAASRRSFPEFPGIRGRVSLLDDGKIGRFGWKGQMPTLREFVLTACAVEIGLEVPDHRQAGDPLQSDSPAKGLDLSGEECDALVAFVSSLPAPVRQVPTGADEVRALREGKMTFLSVGCGTCHTPDLGEVEGIYSDLLLHDMGTDLSDTGSYRAPSAPESPGSAAGPVEPWSPRRGIARETGGGSRREPSGVADPAALGRPRFRSLPARRPRRHAGPGDRPARRSGEGPGDPVFRALLAAAAERPGVPQIPGRARRYRPASTPGWKLKMRTVAGSHRTRDRHPDRHRRRPVPASLSSPAPAIAWLHGAARASRCIDVRLQGAADPFRVLGRHHHHVETMPHPLHTDSLRVVHVQIDPEGGGVFRRTPATDHPVVTVLVDHALDLADAGMEPSPKGWRLWKGGF